ncbi:GGDEF domain-containing protein [Ancylobacter sp. Lp-2]|uniref:GGDEF domain-containing protein n=1 Tax=Ancylobacter sp. Lp-2 TaxID=2881339 RepID=UPI001E554656|nr:GGDEF domain-containing protein [Ancylobacter sp. Lp-2]MCB4769284.1 GGDEF domain-containing protein [Ancylobacter sp. Lp-2]
MPLDYPSLLIAIGFSAICLAVILFASGVTSRRENFLLTTATAAIAVVGSVFSYSVHVAHPSPVLVFTAFTFLLTGMSILFGAARQFRLGTSPIPRILAAASIALPLGLAPFILGYDGIGFIVVNLLSAILLTLTAQEYWRGRSEAPVAIASMCGLYLLVGFSFACCGLVLLANGQWVLDAPPANWAEQFNAIVVIAGVAGIGALALALNQSRLAQAHKHDAMTDPLTGLLNRRALFDMIEAMAMGREIAVIAFDIDRFKVVNDTYGHAVGDRVLVHFARALRQHLGKGQLAARLGGEEFALVLSDTGPDTALAHAEAVRASFTKSVQAAKGFTCTVSAGIAFGRTDAGPFEATLNAADQMLYRAKRAGRDRVVVDGLDAGWPESQPALFTQPSSSRP